MSAVKLYELSYEFSEAFEDLEKRWVARHQQAQDMLNATGVSPVVPLDGLLEFLTRGLDESFERESCKLNSQFDEAAKDIV